MGKSRVCGISTGARCAPLQRGRNRNDEMRLQRWAASLQRLDAFATDGCIAVPRRGAHCAPVSYIAAPVTVITTMFREDARRVIGATAKPLYPIDGKAAGFDRRTPKTSLFEGGGPPQRWKEFVPRRGAHCAPVSYIAAPVTVITTMFREDARRVIGATAKPLYPIDGKAAGFDRRNPKTSLFEGGGPPQRWKEFVPRRGAHCAPVRPRRYNNNPSKGRAKGLRGDRKALRLIRRQGRRP